VKAPWHPQPGFAHAARVALAASALIGLVYVGCAVILNTLATRHFAATVDATLRERLADARTNGLFAQPEDHDEIDEAPVVLWMAYSPGRPVALTPGAPAISSDAPAAGRALTVRLRSADFRLAAVRYHGGVLIAGQSMADQDRLEAVLRVGEALAAPVLLLAVFLGSLIIGLRALAPVERSRQRQLDFTADASHELRTPLSVISAETSIALRGERDAAAYRAALTQIQAEGGRLSTIVEDLLWLARFDSRPPPPRNEPVDLATIASDCAERFSAVADAGSFKLSVADTSVASARISAPAEWIERLLGVLVDNACRYAGESGQVRIGVSNRGNRVCLTVEDSGPGIPAQERDRLFDRFHRSTDQGGAAGLGLAIADSIVRITSGQWRVADSELGGALFEVSWRRMGHA
jgi:signal transduction histidine kinase